MSPIEFTETLPCGHSNDSLVYECRHCVDALSVQVEQLTRERDSAIERAAASDQCRPMYQADVLEQNRLRLAAEAEAAQLTRERDEVRAFIANALPFLREAWEACFHGQSERLLSAEERGMGSLILRFQAIADGKPPTPIGMVTNKDCARQVDAAMEWAHRLLGSPNELREELRDYMYVGETCAHGLERAHGRVKEADAKVAALLRVARAAKDASEHHREVVCKGCPRTEPLDEALAEPVVAALLEEEK